MTQLSDFVSNAAAGSFETTPLPASLALAEATGSGEAFIYEVGSAATIELTAPNSTVGGVATFTASKHGEGAKLLVSDSAAGEWDVSEVGAPTSGAYQTQHETLTYAATAVEGVSFTHSQNQATGNSIGNVFIEDLNIVRRYLGNGLASVKITGEITTYVQDAAFDLTLPTGTLSTPFIESARAFRPVLNVTDYILLDVAPDVLTFNRDDQINDSDPCYFEVEGIGNWVGERPDATVLAGHVTPTELNRLYVKRNENGASIQSGLGVGTTSNAYANSTPVDFAVGTIVQNSGGMIDGSNGQFIAPEDGYYVLSGSLTVNDNGTNSTRFRLAVGDTTTEVWATEQSATANFAAVIPFHYEQQLSAGDRLDVRVGTDTLETGELTAFSVSFAQQAISSVVDPGLVPVEDLAITKMSRANQASTTQGVLSLDTIEIDTAGFANTGSGGVEITADGTYTVKAQATIAPASGGFAASLTLRNNGVQIASATANNGAGAANVHLTLAEDFVLTDTSLLTLETGYAGNAAVNNVVLSVTQLASKTVTYVDPAFTEAKDLDYYAAHWDASQLGTDHPSTVVTPASTTNIVDNGDRTWTLSNGRFKVEWWPTLDQAAGTAGQRITVDGTPVGLYGDRMTAEQADVGTGSPAFAYVDATSSSKVVSTQGGGNNVDEFHKIRIEQLPSTEYVTPGDVPVEDVEELVFSTTNALDGGAFSFGSYADVAAMQAAGFTRLRIQSQGLTASTNVEGGSTFVDLADIVANQRIAYHETDSAGFIIVLMDNGALAGGTFIVNGYTGNTVKIYAVKAQKTVINTTDVPVQNQNTQVDGGILKWNATDGAYEPFNGPLGTPLQMALCQISATQGFGPTPGGTMVNITKRAGSLNEDVTHANTIELLAGQKYLIECQRQNGLGDFGVFNKTTNAELAGFFNLASYLVDPGQQIQDWAMEYTAGSTNEEVGLFVASVGSTTGTISGGVFRVTEIA